MVFPLNWDRRGSHKIDHKIAKNFNFGEDFARNHCKIQCFCIIFCMKNISQEHPFCFFGGGLLSDSVNMWSAILGFFDFRGSGHLEQAMQKP